MITKRITFRQTVAIYLSEILTAARNEKAAQTELVIDDNVEPILSLTAYGGAAPVPDMLALLEKDNFPNTAMRYLDKNWLLIDGIVRAAEIRRPDGTLTLAGSWRKSEISRLLEELKTAIPPITSFDLPGLLADIDSAALAFKGNRAKVHADSVAVLIRETIGLPGDADVAARMPQEQVQIAVMALAKLGVTVEPDLMNQPPADEDPRP